LDARCLVFSAAAAAAAAAAADAEADVLTCFPWVLQITNVIVTQ
jgi:hypothetical protein